VQVIKCPYCGPREEVEFTYGGQAHVAYPGDPSALSDEEWAHYLFFRDNPRGLFEERWVHTLGCRRWFNAVRDTVTYRFHHIYHLDQTRPNQTQPNQNQPNQNQPNQNQPNQNQPETT
jgi:sarcosine oxidase subunit delta